MIVKFLLKYLSNFIIYFKAIHYGSLATAHQRVKCSLPPLWVLSNGSLDGRRRSSVPSNRNGWLATTHQRVLRGKISLSVVMNL